MNIPNAPTDITSAPKTSAITFLMTLKIFDSTGEFIHVLRVMA